MKRGRNPVRRLNLVERSILVAKWRSVGVAAQIQALTGENADRLVAGAGRVFFVMLHALCAHGIHHDEPDVRVLRGAVNALEAQAGEPEITDTRRAGIISGLEACERLLPRLSQAALADAALYMEYRLARGDVRFSDFMDLIEQTTTA